MAFVFAGLKQGVSGGPPIPSRLELKIEQDTQQSLNHTSIAAYVCVGRVHCSSLVSQTVSQVVVVVRFFYQFVRDRDFRPNLFDYFRSPLEKRTDFCIGKFVRWEEFWPIDDEFFQRNLKVAIE